MRIFAIVLFLLPLFGYAQVYFQQEVNHTIRVKLNDTKHTLSAYEEIEYTNNSPDNLDTLYFHLWPNAYKSTFSELGRQKLEDGDLDLHFSDSVDRGFIDSLDFKMNGKPVRMEYHPNHQDIALLILPEPIKSWGGKATITTPFRVKIPDASFSRLGHVEESYMITQWFPKPAVYDMDGWHPMPYLGQGEFYSEYGSYDVSITLPKNYVVGATGDLQNQEELAWLEEKDEKTRKKIADGTLAVKGIIKNEFPKSANEFKTIRYVQKNVHDFAWFADKRFHVLKSSVDLPRTKQTVTSWAMFTNQNAELWQSAPVYLDSAIYYYSLWNGDYPYNQVTAVDGTIAAGGGMEYPNVTVIGSTNSAFLLEQVIVHEVGHNWFYGILGSNERDHPWMDEGLNSLNENRYIETRYPNASLSIALGANGSKIGSMFGLDKVQTKGLHEYSYLLNARRNLDQPIELGARKYTPSNYGGIVYSKTAIVFDYLLAYLGDSLFDHCMHVYYDTWHFKHPGPEDLRKIFEKETGKDLSWFFNDLIQTTGKIDYAVKGFKKEDGKTYLKVVRKGDVASPYSLDFMKDGKVLRTVWIDEKSAPFGLNQKHQLIEVQIREADQIRIDHARDIPEINRSNNMIRTSGIFKTAKPIKFQWLGGVEDPEVNTLYYTPLLGWNKYDGLMAGFSFYNHTFPEKKFEYTLTPMFGLGTLRPVGIGDAHYHFYPHHENYIQRITLGGEYSTFHFQNNDIGKGRYQKIMPYLEIDFQNPNNRRARWKHKASVNYSIVENFTPSEVAINEWDLTQAFRAGYRLSNSQVLKPFSLKLDYEQGQFDNNMAEFALQDYVKASVEAKWRFNYNWNLDGVDLRVFAGYFFKNNTTSSRFNWQLDGQNGVQDYLYDQIFLGRRQQHPDFLSQQMVENHGAFKAPTGFGSSNSWLVAGNIKIDLPIPLIGLYADAGMFPVFVVNTGQTESRFLYNAGIHIPIRKGIVDIYVPIAFHEDIQSEYEFRDVNFLQRIRFTFNLKQLNPFKAIKQLDL